MLQQSQEASMADAVEASVDETRKPYSKPEIVHSMTLETRAGSPIGEINPLLLPFGKGIKNV